MSITTQTYSEQTSPTTTFSSQSATSVSFSDQTSSTSTFTEVSPTLEGTFFGAGDYDTEFYEARTLIMGRAG
jgi:hypothetical protein